MRKKIKSIAILSLIAVFSVVSALCLFACNKEEIKFVTPEIRYMAGDNIDAFDYVSRKEGYTYKFAVQKKGSDEKTEINGRTFVVQESGTYILHCTESLGGSVSDGSTEITVYDTLPTVIVPNNNITLDLNSEYPVNSLIGLNGNVFVVSESSTVRMIDYGTYFKDESDVVGETKQFYDSTKPMEEFNLSEYRKINILFDKEGTWIFHVSVQNKGGTVDGMFRVYVVENVDDLENIAQSKNLTFDRGERKASWDAYEGAAGYRVTLGKYKVSTENATVDFSDLSYKTLEFLDLVVVPYDEEGKNFGKKLVAEKPADKQNGATVDYYNGSLSMINKSAAGTTANVAAMWSQYWYYYAFTGNYGVGYYLDFTFTGYQMPQFIFFASTGSTEDKAYASLSTYGTGANGSNSVNLYSRKGVVVINGLLGNGDYLQAFGPNRMFRTGTSSNPIYDEYGKEGSGLFRIGKDDENGAYKELTRAGQKENANKEYALTVGTFIGKDGKVWLEMLLKDATTGAEVCHLQKSLGLTEAEVGTGDIIILPPLGNDGEYLVDASIAKGGTTMELKSFSAPYVNHDSYVNVKTYGATVNSDGSLTMANKSLENNSKKAGKWAQYFNYYSFVGDYGVGYYLDFEFTGYNMPQLIFFAKCEEGDEGYASPTNYKTGTENGTEANRQGVLVLNGFADADGYFQVFGPKRMYGTTQKYGEQGNQTRMFLSYENYPELTRKGQVENKDKKYSLTIGTHIGSDGKVWMEVILSSNGTEIYHVDQSLGLTEEEVGVGDIIIMPPYGDYNDSEGNVIFNGSDKAKGLTSSTFTSFSDPYKKNN